MSPQPKVAFGAYPVGIRVTSRLHSYLLNQWMDFDRTCTDTLLGGRKKWLDFGDHDLIFWVTPALNFQILTRKSLSAPTFEPNDGFWPNFRYHFIGIIKRID